MRVRFAPSPTGFLHLGGLRTALFNYLAAKSTGGAFILRIEDTDQSRVVPGAMEHLIDTLNWLKLPFDEGPGRSSNGLDYIQSKRLDVYQKYANHLIAKNLAYKCFCPKQTLLLPKRYNKKCRFSNNNNSADHQSFVIRLAAPEAKQVVFDDINYGQISNEPIDDVVLIKSDGFPTYHFANVIDDHEMKVDLVMRGQEWLPSTAIHKALYEALEWKPPSFCHLPLLLDHQTKAKLSKRQDSARVEWYRRQGFLPQALINFTAFLGWTPSVCYEKREILNMDELVQAFDLNSLNKADAIVDLNRLKWFNRHHLQQQNSSALATELSTLANVEPHYALKIIDLMKGRMNTLQELKDTGNYFFNHPSQPPKVTDKTALSFIANLHSGLSLLRQLNKDNIHILLDCLRTTDRMQSKANMLAARQAITGTTIGPALTSIMCILGREVVLERLQRTLNLNIN